MKPATVNFTGDDSFYRGDEFEGIAIDCFDDTAKTIESDLDGATAICQVKKQKNISGSVLSWSTEDGNIDITGNTVTLNARDGADMDVEGGKYYYDIQLTYSDGKVQTIVSGQFEIVDDVTRE